jgi:hypothetical protein
LWHDHATMQPCSHAALRPCHMVVTSCRTCAAAACQVAQVCGEGQQESCEHDCAEGGRRSVVAWPAGWEGCLPRRSDAVVLLARAMHAWWCPGSRPRILRVGCQDGMPCCPGLAPAGCGWLVGGSVQRTCLYSEWAIAVKLLQVCVVVITDKVIVNR